MKKIRLLSTAWGKGFERSWRAFARSSLKAGQPATVRAARPKVRQARAPAGAGSWTPGLALGHAGARRFRLYRPPGLALDDRLPLMVMLHGCGQDAASFAASTRMNQIALRERFIVLYPEQDKLANLQGCWNWFDTRSGRAHAEAAMIMQAIDQVCLLYPVDPTRVAIAGMSAGASMAALVVTRHPGRFKAVVMHSGIPPGSAHSSLTALGAMHGRGTGRALAATPQGVEALWPPLLVIHGAADHVVSPHNAQAAAAQWAGAGGATPGGARQLQRGQRYPASVTDFKRQGHTVARLVEVAGLAHAWSGGAASQAHSDARGPDASRMAWAFAARQFRA